MCVRKLQLQLIAIDRAEEFILFENAPSLSLNSLETMILYIFTCTLIASFARPSPIKLAQNTIACLIARHHRVHASRGAGVRRTDEFWSRLQAIASTSPVRLVQPPAVLGSDTGLLVLCTSR